MSRRRAQPPRLTDAELLQLREAAADAEEIAEEHAAEMGTREFLVWPGSMVRGFAVWRRS